MDLEAESSKIDTVGLILTLSASALSGLSGALTQRAITSDLKSGGSPRNSFVFSMELATYGIIFLLLKELVSFLWFGGGLFSDTHALTAGWSVHAAIPVLANVNTSHVYIEAMSVCLRTLRYSLYRRLVALL